MIFPLKNDLFKITWNNIFIKSLSPSEYPLGKLEYFACIILATSSDKFEAAKAFCKQHISPKIQPNAHISLFASYSLPSHFKKNLIIFFKTNY